MSALSLALPLSVGILFAWMATRQYAKSGFFRILFSIGLGILIGLVTDAFFTLISIWLIPEYRMFPLILEVPAAALCVVRIYFRREKPGYPDSNAKVIRPSAALLFSISMLIIIGNILYVIVLSSGMPHGNWDAWAMWNTRARILAFSDHWQDVFSPYLAHADYPILLPLWIAGKWRMIGSATPLVPICTQIIIYIGILFLAIGFIGLYSGAVFAAVGGVVIAIFASLPEYMPWQYADPLIAFTFVSAMVCLLMLDHTDEIAGYIAAGMCIGAPIAVKAEGGTFFVFAISALMFRLWYRSEQRMWRMGKIAGFVSGMAVPIFVFLFGKIFGTSHSDMFGHLFASGSKILYAVTDLQRHITIIRHIYHLLTPWIPLMMLSVGFVVCYSLYEKRKFEPLCLAFFLIVLAQCGIYYLAYLFTPHDLGWHLATSADRLILQISPAFLILLFSLFPRLVVSGEFSDSAYHSPLMIHPNIALRTFHKKPNRNTDAPQNTVSRS